MSSPFPLESDPQDVALDADGDILLDETGLHFVSGKEAVVQGVLFRLRMFKGEWQLNQDIGVPYFEELIGDASKVAGVEDRARAAFGAAILDVPGVDKILQLDVKLDRSTRKMTVTWRAQCSFGDSVVAEGTVEV